MCSSFSNVTICYFSSSYIVLNLISLDFWTIGWTKKKSNLKICKIKKIIG